MRGQNEVLIKLNDIKEALLSSWSLLAITCCFGRSSCTERRHRLQQQEPENTNQRHRYVLLAADL